MSDNSIDDLATVSAFLAMALKQDLMLNGYSARDAWDAHCRLFHISDKNAELLCRMLGDVPDD
jgi:hypothetical protein